MRLFCLISALIALFSFSCCKNSNTAPILILGSEKDFGTYAGEILKAEGFNEFILDSPGNKKISISYLNDFRLVILGNSALYDIAMIRDYVKNGGNLIAFAPDSQLDEVFGISGREGEISDGNLIIDSSTEEGAGLIGKELQFHGVAARYNNAEGKVLAYFIDEDSSGKFPAVVSNDYGKGNAVAFLYNLPQSIVYTRQGNPALAGLETDSINGLRAMDLFTGGWIRTSANTLNQADEQMRLLSGCIMSVIEDPLPRFWYFPDSLKCLVTLTNDGETNGENDFEPQFRDIDSLGARMTIYVMETNKVSAGWVEKWTKKGFEISGHPNNTAEATNPVWNHVSEILAHKQNEISKLYGLKMNTVVNHWFVWCGKDSLGNPEFAAQAEIEAKHGIGLDANYAHYDNNAGEGHFLGPLGREQGNYNGSGLPMKFATSSGKVLDIYQHLNNVYDQQYMENKDEDGYYEAFEGLMERSIDDEVYSYISIKSHNDEYFFSRKPLMKMITYANTRSIPVWTASELNDFLRTRDEASFENLRWSGNKLDFLLSSPLKGKAGLTFMVPAKHKEKSISEVSIDGERYAFFLRLVKGREYAFVTVKPGRNYKVSAGYGE